MRYRSIIALGLGLAATLTVNGQAVFAQRASTKAYRQPLPRTAVSAKGRTTSAAYMEDLPSMGATAGSAPTQPMPPGGMRSDPFADDSGAFPDYGASSECCDDYCSDVPCDTGCCSTCGPQGGCLSGQCFITAD